ncbi:MAG: oligoendopeptidase F [candidate division Zixibacteria bacterium RBG_16_53_22]|nr:MAG: oligoendopeptidase F [candidate division Zixibacteria bacterium RBG_16_53_22]
MVAPAASAQNAKIPQRADIEAKYKWRLDDIYPDTLAWEADFARLQTQMGEIAKFQGHLGESAETLYRCLSLRDSLSSLLDRLFVYAHMKKDEDTRIPEYQALADRVSTLSAHFGEKAAFIRPEIIAIPNQTLDNYLSSDKNLKLYGFYIDKIMRLKSHILSPKEEAILALSSIATRGPSNIFDMLDNADIEYPSIKDEKGREIKLTKERYYKILESTDRRVRRDASKAYNEAYLNYVNTLGATLSASVNSDWFYAQARGYETTLESDLDGDNIPSSVFENLITTVDASLPALHKWTALKKKHLKLEKIYPYDLNVPFAPEAKIEIPYDSAMAIIMKAVAPMGSQYLSDLQTGFGSGWVDVYETEGKQSGAYSWGAYSTHPYVLLNYVNSTENFFTVAHEMGHAMHSFYTHKGQPYIYEDYATFVAEVASTANEALLINYLLNSTTNKRQKLYLLNFYIEQIIGTFYTQVMFSEFEKTIHDIVEQGGALSAESMRKIYGDLYKKYWGPELAMEDWQNLGGLRIPHFYRSYYVFQYATSYAAAQALTRNILSGDLQARERYLELLACGGSDYPVELLKKAGVDMTQPEAVNATVKLFAGLVDQVEVLLREQK